MELLRLLRRDPGFWTFVALLTGLSIFFGVSAELHRRQLGRSANQAPLESGVQVSVVEILDGDEIAVRGEAGTPFVVRILGIKAFESTSFEPGISAFGARALRTLRDAIAGKRVALVFPEFKQDRNGRVLAFVQLEKRDVGRELVRGGLALVFTRYDFSREEEYLSAQAQARSERKGLWSSDKASERALALIASWEATRSDV